MRLWTQCDETHRPRWLRASDLQDHRKTKDHKIVVHYVSTIHAKAVDDELIFQRTRMNQHHVARFAEFQRLSNPYGNAINLAVSFSKGTLNKPEFSVDLVVDIRRCACALRKKNTAE